MELDKAQDSLQEQEVMDVEVHDIKEVQKKVNETQRGKKSAVREATPEPDSKALHNAKASNAYVFKKRLINAVRKHKVLYNPKNSDFPKVDVKDLVWTEIAEALQEDGTKTLLKF